MPMKTSRSCWQSLERRVAELFRCRRNWGSGSCGIPGKSSSDTDHPRLYLEAKVRQTHAVRTLHDETREKARREGKMPVLALADKGRPGFLVCVHSDDFEAVVLDYCLSHIPELKGRVRHQWVEIVPVDEAPGPA